MDRSNISSSPHSFLLWLVGRLNIADAFGEYLVPHSSTVTNRRDQKCCVHLRLRRGEADGKMGNSRPEIKENTKLLSSCLMLHSNSPQVRASRNSKWEIKGKKNMKVFKSFQRVIQKATPSSLFPKSSPIKKKRPIPCRG